MPDPQASDMRQIRKMMASARISEL